MKARLEQQIGQFQKGKVLVVGDLAIDEMVYGSTARVSREAPVIILNHKETHIILGAAANAAHNIAKLGAQRIAMIGVTGQDYYTSLLMDALDRDGVDSSYLIADPSRPTTTKTRISGIANQSVTQQIVRIDREACNNVSPVIENQMLDLLTQLAPEFDAILLSDYGLGVLTPSIVEHSQTLAQKHQLILAVDSQKKLAHFQGATILTPNQPEAEQNVGYSLDKPEQLMAGGKELLEQTNADSVLITRGGEGMALFEKNGTFAEIPAFNRSEVFDVTGAGDTVVGTLTLALATGASLLDASVLGNLAASIVVKRFGASTTTTQELIQALHRVDEQLLNRIVPKDLCKA